MLLLLPLVVLLSLPLMDALPLSKQAQRSEFAVKETHFSPRQWTNVGKPAPGHVMNLKIGLRNKRFDELERHLYEISDPTHHRYRQHYSKEQLHDLVKPDDDASYLVNAWLEDNGIRAEDCHRNAAGNWISVQLTIGQIEKMLYAQYSLFQHEDGSVVARTTEWSLPQHLHTHISTIQPTTTFLRAKPKLVKVTKSPKLDLTFLANAPNASSLHGVCSWAGMTPACLQRMYGTEGYIPRSLDSHIAFANYLDEVPSRSDAAMAMSNLRKEAEPAAQSFSQISIAGGPIDNGSTRAGLEANLDLQTILGQAWPIKITSYSTGGSPPFTADLNTRINTNEPYLDWLEHLLEQDYLPQTISTSYGDDEQTVPASYAKVVCEGFAQLGMRGVSLLFSSGDFGVGTNGTCLSNDGRNATMFMPTFPASCPYVTAVGGTFSFPEIVANDASSGYVSASGFSNYFAQPAYQKVSGVVDKYIEGLEGKHAGLFNAAGRAFPDVAAQSYRYLVFVRGSVLPLDGTSAAAPTVASIFAFINDALMADGQKPLGFLNPWLYLAGGGKTFTDVVEGSSIGCDTDGFAAKEGWDVASGWGTPQFESILESLGLSKNGTQSKPVQGP